LDPKKSVSLVYPNYSDYVDDRNENICHDFVINNAKIAKYVNDEFGHYCYGKKIPRWIKKSSKRKIKNNSQGNDGWRWRL
jgi:hypothetical protein